jgi:hypothetical protein
MKLGYIATMVMTGVAAAAIAVAPSASAANPNTGTDGGNAITTHQTPAHVAMQATPPDVSDARKYGQFSSPAPLLGD